MRRQVCQCPLCKKNFQKRPELQINRTLKEITEQFKSMSRGKVTRRSSVDGGGGGKQKKGGGGRGWDGSLDELKKKPPRGQKKDVLSESQSEGITIPVS